ncbi:NADH dehydrogenase subunit 2 (mitochondrion) [Branchiostoma belcheri]|uniref:NADH-ubiquinone oxidoreductase chain 2 n=1 Tax=Branchiostoma belcheri TaxID=7741 RepID=Q85UI8_BRABE|nr:NADH dehydrogenase subunit 2 [Branchiostoma belcheri]BAC55193.1 NADH dehydrogenase subunit 2 [Branchiostoma belcheri]
MSPYISPLFGLAMGSSVLLISSSTHWVFVWLGLELGTLAFIPMLAWWHSSLEVEATVKYFIIQAMAAAVFFFGGLVMTSTEYISGLSQFVGNFGEVLIMFSIIMKLGLVPFHYWVVDVVQGLNYLPGMVLLTWQKVPGLMVLVQLVSMQNGLILLIFGALSAFWGGLGGLGQTQMRKLLAFSSIAHLGWLVSGCVVGTMLGSMYFILYVVLSIPVFVFLYILNNTHLNQVRASLVSNPVAAMVVGVGFLSLAGLPPFMGFFGKWLVLTWLLNNFLVGGAVALVVGALVSLFYYLRVSYMCMVILGPQQIMVSLSWRKGFMGSLLGGLVVLNLLGLLLVGGISSLSK